MNTHRFVSLVLVTFLSLLAGCGGGGGGTSSGASSEVDVSPIVISGEGISISASARAFKLDSFIGEAGLAQTVTLRLESSGSDVYIDAEVMDSRIADVDFQIVGDDQATLTIRAKEFAFSGDFSTTIRFTVFGDPFGNQELVTYSFPVNVSVRKGLSSDRLSLWLSANEARLATATISLSRPENLAGTLSVSAVDGVTPTWLSWSLVGATLSVVGDATKVPQGSYSTDLRVTFKPSISRPSLSISIPVALTVGPGLEKPPNQALTFDSRSNQAALASSVSISRADGGISPWTAQSSQSWLALSRDSGSTNEFLGFGINLAEAQKLPPYSLTTATVTIGSPGSTTTSFTVSLNRQLPYIASIAPYAVPAGATHEMTLGGKGFSQYTNLSSAIQIQGVSISNVRYVSDSMLTLNVLPSQAGTFTATVANAANDPKGNGTLVVAGAAGNSNYPSALLNNASRANPALIQDSARRVIYTLDESRQRLVKHSYSVAGWQSTVGRDLLRGGFYAMALSPEGKSIWHFSLGQLSEYDAETLNFIGEVAGVQPPGQHNLSLNGLLPVSADGRIWLSNLRDIPNAYQYFDLVERRVKVAENLPADLAGGNILTGSYSFRYVVFRSISGFFSPTWRYSASTGAFETFLPGRDSGVGIVSTLTSDGAISMNDQGALYRSGGVLVGQLPVVPANQSRNRIAMTPDGSKVLVVTRNSTDPQTSYALEIYDTNQFVQATTNFTMVRQIPFTVSYDACLRSASCFPPYLLPSNDSDAVFVIGPETIQVITLTP